MQWPSMRTPVTQSANSIVCCSLFDNELISPVQVPNTILIRVLSAEQYGQVHEFVGSYSYSSVETKVSTYKIIVLLLLLTMSLSLKLSNLRETERMRSFMPDFPQLILT